MFDYAFFGESILKLLEKTNNPNPSPIEKIWFGLYCFGAGDRTRTGTLSPAVDFESTTSTIPSHRQLYFQWSSPKRTRRNRRSISEVHQKTAWYSIPKKHCDAITFAYSRRAWRTRFWVLLVYHSNTPAYCLYSIVHFRRNCKKKFSPWISAAQRIARQLILVFNKTINAYRVNSANTENLLPFLPLPLGEVPRRGGEGVFPSQSRPMAVTALP